MTLTITSEIGDSVFYPHVMIVDAQGQVVETYENTVFEYRKPRLHLGNRLVAELDSTHRKATNRCLSWFTPNSKTYKVSRMLLIRQELMLKRGATTCQR